MPGKVKDGLIVRGRKKSARTIRKGVNPLQNEDGTHSTHVMASGESGRSKYPYEVNPTVFPNNGGKTWTDLRDNPREAYNEASKRGEMYGFKSAKKAEKFAYGLPWKQGEDKKDARRAYKEEKKSNNLYTQSEEFKKDKERLRSERPSNHIFQGSKKK